MLIFDCKFMFLSEKINVVKTTLKINFKYNTKFQLQNHINLQTLMENKSFT